MDNVLDHQHLKPVNVRRGFPDDEHNMVKKQLPSVSSTLIRPAIMSNIDVCEDRENMRIAKFRQVLDAPTTNLTELRKFSWHGIPRILRGNTWRILSGYIPTNTNRRSSTLERKRVEYRNFITQYYDSRLDPLYEDMFWQIRVDIPRTNPLIPFFQLEVVQNIFERILFIWSIRHPASGYVQGINDLVIPFFVVFLNEYIEDVDKCNINEIPTAILDCVEADAFWCLSKLLDGIQNNYIFAQPGIQVNINALQTLVSRINEPLNNLLRSYKIDYLHFSFRWMNNLLMRELPLAASIRLWDTYWSETDGFFLLHLYVCAALLNRFSDDILSKKSFTTVMTFLQNLPCDNFSDDDVSQLLSEAYQLKYMFGDAPHHLMNS